MPKDIILTKLISVRVSEDVFTRLEKKAEELNKKPEAFVTVPQLIRVAIESYLDRPKRVTRAP